MADVAHGIEARHVLFLEEIDGVTFALREQRHEHICARHFVPPRILHVQDSALHHALEPRRRLGVLAVLDDERQQFMIDIFHQRAAQRVQIDVTCLHHLRRVGIVEQRQQEVFQSRVFVMAVAGKLDRAMQDLFEAAG